MSSNKRRLMRALHGGGCGCKPSDIYDPTPKPKPKISIYQNTNPNCLTPSTSTTTTTSGDRIGDEEDFTSTTVSETETHHEPSTKLSDSIAVEKDSKDPHKDFRNSMLQMIFEREIYTEPDLQELLECFLQLNAPCHHQVIIQAFIEICEETFPKKIDGGGGEPSRRKEITGKGRR